MFGKKVVVRCVKDRAQIGVCRGAWRVEVWMAGWLTARLSFDDVVDAADEASKWSPRWRFARGVER